MASEDEDYRREREAREVEPGPDDQPGDGAMASFLGKAATSNGAGKFYSVNPVVLLGDEVEGGAVSQSVDAGLSIKVAGRDFIPSAGSLVVVDFDSYRWVSESCGPASLPTGSGYLRFGGSACISSVPNATLTLTGPGGVVYYSGGWTISTLLSLIPLGTYTLTISAPGWTSTSGSVTVLSGNNSSGSAASLFVTVSASPDGSGFDPCSCVGNGGPINAFGLPIYPPNTLSVTDPAGNTFSLVRTNSIGGLVSSVGYGQFWGFDGFLPTHFAAFDSGCANQNSFLARFLIFMRCPVSSSRAILHVVFPGCDGWVNGVIGGPTSQIPKALSGAFPSYNPAFPGGWGLLNWVQIGGSLSWSGTAFHFTSLDVSHFAPGGDGLGTSTHADTSGLIPTMGWTGGVFDVTG